MRVIRPLLAVEVFAVAETLDLTAPARPRQENAQATG
jgi:hypothetical protein